MQVINCEYDYDADKYIIQFEHQNVTWFRELDTNHVYYDRNKYRDWLNSLIEDVKLRSDN